MSPANTIVKVLTIGKEFVQMSPHIGYLELGYKVLMLMFSIGLAVAGVVLIIVSIMYKRKASF